ncbi:MAG: prepilin-type N-terminal cleavage/methylation domain-containing protein [Phycisphaerales bacterium]|nr:prepilin-type N-terminal cleavage/methylation domain-containing protein [Phycisphaerales bacterium]
MSGRRAFSLLEVMLAIGIVLVLSGVVYTFLFDLMDSRDRVVRYGDQSRVGVGMIETIERDLMTTLAGGTRFGPGLRGSPTSMTLLSRGVTLPIENDSQTVLGDMQGVRFEWERSSRQLRASRWDVLSGESAMSEVISDQVEYLQFRYYDGRQWSGSFDSGSAGRLPVAIEVAVWFGDRQAETSRGRTRGAGLEGRVGPSRRDLDAALDAEWEDEELSAPDLPLRDPDRVRVMAVPDAPEVTGGGAS